MTDVIRLAKLIGPPGSMGFLALCCAIGLLIAWIAPRSRRVAGGWLLLVFFTYVIAGMPLVSRAVTSRLPPYAPLWEPGGPGDTDILVVLSGDNPWGRARETRWALNVMTPRCVLVSGSPSFVRIVVHAGVPREGLVADDTTSTTQEQIAKLPEWAARCGADRIVLIASTLSMPRVAELVRTLTVPVVLAPSPLDNPPAHAGIRRVVPSFRALRVTRDAVYEHLALGYYRYRGWIRH